MDYDQHHRVVTDLRRVAGELGWAAWAEPEFFGHGLWRVLTASPGTQTVAIAQVSISEQAARALVRNLAQDQPAAKPEPVKPEPVKLPARKTAILDALAAVGGGMSMVELATALDVPKVGLRKCIQDLLEDGLVTAIGNTRARRYHAASPSESRGPAEQAQPATDATAPGDLQPPAPASPTLAEELDGLIDDDGHEDGAPEPCAPPLDPISPRVRRELAREEADRAKQAAAGTPPVSALLRRRIALYFSAHGRTDTLAGLAAKVNLTGDAVRPTVNAMLASGALEVVPGATPVRYRQPEARAA